MTEGGREGERRDRGLRIDETRQRTYSKGTQVPDTIASTRTDTDTDTHTRSIAQGSAMCVCVCVCVLARARALFLSVRSCTCVYVCLRVRVSMHASECTSCNVRRGAKGVGGGGEREWRAIE
jgi:hypothetical protein